MPAEALQPKAGTECGSRLGMISSLPEYPATFRGRNKWIAARRGNRNSVDASVPYAFLQEQERAASGRLTEVATVFLTNRECPWKCFMCDLWQNTLESSVARGDIPRQIDFAFESLALPADEEARQAFQVKLYNSGSFFDPKAIPLEDDTAVAERLDGFSRVIVESHPRLIGDRCRRFHERLRQPLEVAMGLETTCPEALSSLNKGFGLDDFRRACDFLRREGISIRVFLLVNCPFVAPDQQRDWTRASVQWAADAGAEVICLIPTRQDSGALATLVEQTGMVKTSLKQLETAMDDALVSVAARVFVDLWDLGQFSRCSTCLEARRERLIAMNHRQMVLERVRCPSCLNG